MPHRAVLPAVSALVGLAVLGGLYATSSAPAGATLVNHLVAGESGRWFATMAGVIALAWGASGLAAEALRRLR